MPTGRLKFFHISGGKGAGDGTDGSLDVTGTKDIKDSYYRYLRLFLAKDETTATTYDKYMALAYAIRSELVDNWIKTQKYYHSSNIRRVYYLSMEYVFGKSLSKNMVNLGLEKDVSAAVGSMGVPLQELLSQEDDFELGNGGKGRAAACFLESMATHGIPALAYGLRYDYAQFQQEIRNGLQYEKPNDWLHKGHPWEIVRPEYACTIGFAGDAKLRSGSMATGPYDWHATEAVHAVPYDVPVSGYRNQTVNTLRLWSARASQEFLPDYINHGDYVRACEEKSLNSRITKVLFPEEDVRRATELRIKQQYFFISAAIQDIVRRYKAHNATMDDFDKKVVIQLGGSRCALAIAELMRILVDIENVPWTRAWEITQNVFAYSSYAVSRDNLELWPVYKLAQIIPRHMQIIFDINQMHLDKIRAEKGSGSDLVRDLSLIEEGEVKRVRLADLAVLGSFSINGVSREQTEILRKKVFPHFSVYYPQRFNCKTIGIAHRNWLLGANKPLSELITSEIGEDWSREPDMLQRLESRIDDPVFLEKFAKVKKNAKIALVDNLQKKAGISIDHTMMFDIQCTKIHLLKRQVMNVMHVLHRYIKAKRGEFPLTKRVHIFAGKASPSDFLAKQIIHLINVVADMVNKDEEINKYMKVVFIPDFGIDWAEQLIPAADLSEQLSVPTLEAAGTFGMKFAFNGAVTISSKSGANNELIQKIGDEYIFSFGKTADELFNKQDYRPSEQIISDQRLKDTLTFIDSLIPKIPDGHSIFPLLASIRDSDRQFVLLDFSSYVAQQEKIDKLYTDTIEWSKIGLLNIARASWFSTDRAVMEYAREIWKVRG